MKRLVIAAVAVAAAFATLLSIAPWDRRGQLKELPPSLAEEPDLYMRMATIAQHLEDGSLKYRLASEEIRHFESDQVTRLVEPDLTLYADPEPPWRATSRRGTIGQQMGPEGTEEIVKLREQVLLVQTFAGGEQMTLHSQALDIFPDRQYAESDHDVMIESTMGRSRSAGIKSDLKSGLVSLFSSETQPVHTVIESGNR
ncbi:MAG: LPS export ABC transporter periplasmic protein LptC [Pseudomonadales bacterium]|nr:LPS export ABC transporter periplasmic protein LptC [Pseudomonadales bacterium]MDP6470848.1 LPS export ABC transporter periplasmic protein LptC [Pseudomonadales bacterium]MDP6825967.1 LPS export ABC transporter periplasmic protein LptC [Pseudomonadales bacterium]MDP6972279.1 LPS export ABC transporter periplasmic protein LptC [Pseudomonadales bacterium]